MNTPFQTETIEHCGITVQIEYFYDDTMRAPWKECDGHGVIREAYGKPDKKPGEVLISGGRGQYWIYDFQESTKIAKRDKWGVHNAPAGLTQNQITAMAVQRDFEYCKGWIQNAWHYAGVVCTVLDKHGEKIPNVEESCWGFETLDDYHETAGKEMAQALAESEHDRRLNQWRASLKECRARKYWASRDVETIGA